MTYNFETPIKRCGTASLKWDVAEDVTPMWVADMDFITAPCVMEALQKRVNHGVFGYNIVPPEWNSAIINWWRTRHGFEMNKDWLIFCTGAVPAISSIVRKMTTVGENVLIMTPVYNIFFNCIGNNGRNALESRLQYKNGSYDVNWEDFEKKLSNPQTTMLLLCNPHNPIGKIWSKEQLLKIAKLCEKHSVLVVSDEIHCDLTAPDKSYTPFAKVSDWAGENSISCLAPTKSFNLAGLQTAAVSVPNPLLRHKVQRGLNTDEVAEPNSFAVVATIAAYTEGASWLDELRDYIEENKKIAAAFIEEHLPNVKLVPSDATYLLWLDCRSICVYSKEMCKYLAENHGLLLSGGESYGESGNGFLRMNIACSKVQLQIGLQKLKEGLTAYYEYLINLC